MKTWIFEADLFSGPVGCCRVSSLNLLLTWWKTHQQISSWERDQDNERGKTTEEAWCVWTTSKKTRRVVKTHDWLCRAARGLFGGVRRGQEC